jgi:diacylglycerol O-acyltransferase / wax synthase
VHEELQGAPATSLNVPIGPDRALQALRVPLGEVKAVKAALGGTVNDVVLAAVAGGLRTLLLHRGEALPDQGLRVMVPVNVRAGGDEALGNRIISLFVDLPVAEPDPGARYDLVRQATEQRKHSLQPLGAETLLDVAGLAPPVLHSRLAQSLFGTRLFNLTVTNVPGPQLPLYALGAPLRTIVPYVPLAADHAVGVAVLSYDGMLFFGVGGDPDAAPDLDVLTRGIADALEELRTAAQEAVVA